MNKLMRLIDEEKKKKKRMNEEYEKKRHGKKSVLTEVGFLKWFHEIDGCKGLQESLL